MCNSRIPPFSGLFASLRSWRMLLLIVACVLLQNGVLIQVVQSDLAVGYNIEIGNLTSKDAEARAVAKLSNGPNQLAWWKLANVHWHDSAIQRFFVEGPLWAGDMTRLANQNGESACSWNASKIENVTGQNDVILALQNIATATYQMSKSVEGTGKINASMWTVLFSCIDSSSCNEGYMAPVVTIQQPNGQFSYATLWLNLTSKLLFNAIPAFIGKLPPARRLQLSTDADDSELSIVVNVHDSVSECPSTPAVSYRSLLDASYGLVPGSACINFRSSFKLLVYFVLMTPNNGTWSSNTNLTTLEELFSSLLDVPVSTWSQLEYEECSEEPMLIIRPSQEAPKPLLHLCHQNTCIVLSSSNNCSGVGKLGVLLSVIQTPPSKSCKSRTEHTVAAPQIPWAGDHEDKFAGHKQPKVVQTEKIEAGFDLADETSYSTYYTYDDIAYLEFGQTLEVLCTNMTSSKDHEVCHATIDVSEFNSILLLSPQSKWTSTEGKHTSEFNQAPHMKDFNAYANRMCITKVSPVLAFNGSQAAPLQAIQIRARAYLNSFIAEHTLAFTTTNGPATDLANFLALILSTVISAILAIADPFTNFLLRIICRKRPHHLDSRRGSVSRVAKVLFQVMCNVLLSFCSFLPVLYIAWSEREREDPFYTWDLGSNDQSIYNSLGSDLPLRVVYLLHATSAYGSHFIIASTLLVCGTCVIVGVCSARHCNDVFDRYALLERYEADQKAGKLVEETGKAILMRTEASLRIRAFEAIDMPEAQFLSIKRVVDRNDKKQEKSAGEPQRSRSSNRRNLVSQTTGKVDAA